MRFFYREDPLALGESFEREFRSQLPARGSQAPRKPDLIRLIVKRTLMLMAWLIRRITHDISVVPPL